MFNENDPHHHKINRFIGWSLFFIIVVFLVVGCSATKANPVVEKAPELFYDSPEVKITQMRDSVVMGHGTGVFISPVHLITAAHVVMGATDKDHFQITTRESTTDTATVLWVNKDRDVALLRIDHQISEPAPLDCDLPVIGDEIFAEGYPYDIGFTRAYGRVTGDLRSIDAGLRVKWDFAFPIDAVIGPGMSGGPVWKNGKVVGLVVGSRMVNGSPSGFSIMVPAHAVCDLLMRD